MEENNLDSRDPQKTFLKGSAWMTFGSIASRILGALYIIPWYAWMGQYGNIANALTARSYNIYTIFILISTAGIPGAIAKQVAKYNALNEYGIGRKLFHKGLILMAILGVVSARSCILPRHCSRRMVVKATQGRSRLCVVCPMRS